MPIEAPYRLPLWNWAPKDHPYDGFGEPNSILVVCMELPGRLDTDVDNPKLQVFILPMDLKTPAFCFGP